ncbi:MAG: PadR family transcriptional regulator [Sphingomicrobium sp.]
MRFHMNCGPESRRFAGPGSFGFGPGGFNFDFGDSFGANFSGRQGRGGGHRRGRRRMFEGGELRLVLLKLLADQPRHGYELIKAVEDMTGGDYAPSPGIVYPTLTMLEDMGQIAEKKSADSKKVYEATDEGRAHLEENADEVEALMERLEETGVERRRHARPEIGRAIGNMMAALKNRVARDGWNDALLEEITDILDEAAKKIERVGG